MKKYLLTLTTLIAATAVLAACKESSAQQEAPVRQTIPVQVIDVKPRETLAGSYLAGRHAQQIHDWKNASRFFAHVVGRDADNTELKKRAMVLAMGAGKTDRAFELAYEVNEASEKKHALVELFLALENFGDMEYKAAEAHLENMPEGGMADFIAPLLKGWSYAAEGELYIEKLPDNPVHAYHAVLIAHYLGRHEAIAGVMERALKSAGINASDLEKIGDIYAHVGKVDEARDVYETILKHEPESVSVSKKLAALEENEIDDVIETGEEFNIRSVKEGVSRAFLDMARILYGEYSDDSARVFSQMALYLNDDLNEARILMAVISTRNERFDEAIDQYKAIGDKDKSYIEAKKRTAELMARAERYDEAVALLEQLVEMSGEDLDAQAQIGDIRRRQKAYDAALAAYNSVLGAVPAEEEAEYWHVFYARGMSYERLGQWREAEADLEKALSFQPDHPYIMNYLGYGWAEKGIRLPEALEMIEKAVSLQPKDGYIRDSLGWVLYQKGRYEEAVPHLEKAVEILPYDPVINDHLGDAYWRVGRRLEAEFQWRRAKNFSEDEAFVTDLKRKLVSGLKEQTEIREAMQEK